MAFRRYGRYRDRLPASIEVRAPADGVNWKTVARSSAYPILPEGQVEWEELLRYAFECEDLTWRKFDRGDATGRVLWRIVFRQACKEPQQFSIGVSILAAGI